MKNKKLKNSRMPKKRVLLTLLAFAIVGTAFLIKSYAASPEVNTVIPDPNLSVNLAARVTPLNGDCRDLCSIKYDKLKGSNAFYFNDKKNKGYIYPAASLKDIKLDPGFDHSVCVFAYGKGKIQFFDDYEMYAWIPVDSTKYQNYCISISPFQNMPGIMMFDADNLYIANYTLNYLPGYAIGAKYGSFTQSNAQAPKGAQLKSCTKTASDGGPDKFSGLTYYQERYYTFDCTGANASAIYEGDYKSLTLNKSYKLCARAYGKVGDGKVVIVRSDSGVTQQDILQAAQSGDVGSIRSGLTLNLKGAAGRWSSTCTDDFDLGGTILDSLLNSTIKVKAYYIAPKGSYINLTEIYVAQKLN